MQWLEEGTREGEVADSNPAGLIAANFTRKMPEMGGCWPMGASMGFSHFFSGFFSVPTLPSV